MIISPIIKHQLGTVCWLSTTTNLRCEPKIFRKEKVFNGWRYNRNEKWKLSLGKILFIYILYACFSSGLIQFCATQLFIFEVFNFIFSSCPAFTSSAGLTGHYSYSSDLLALSDCLFIDHNLQVNFTVYCLVI